MKTTLNNFPLHFENLPGFRRTKLYNKKAPVRLKRVSPPGALSYLTLHKQLAIMTSITKAFKKGLTRMKVIKKSRLGLYLDLTVGTLVILLNELAAFLYIRDNIKDQHVGYGIAALVVFMSTYIIGKLISRLF